MKIALGLEYPLALRGGVSVLVEKLVEGISKSCEVVLVSPDATDFTHPGVSAHVPWNPQSASRETSRALAERLAELGVSLAHFHFGGNYGWGIRVPGASPFPYLKRRGIRSVSTIHVVQSILEGYCGPQKPLWFKLLLFPGAWVGKLDVLRSVEKEIVISQWGCEKVRGWYWPFRSRFEAVYHSRIDWPQPETRALDREKMILGVGHLAFRKGQHTVAEAFAKIAPRYPDWKMVLIGHDSNDGCKERIDEITAAHNLRDRLLLLGSRNDAADFMSRAAIFAQASTFEGLPLALQEAMYSGCACAATQIMGNDELIENGKSGLMVPPLQPAALAAAFEKLMQDSELRAELGEQAKRTIVAKGMTAKSMIDRHLEIYHEALGRPVTAKALQKPAALVA